MLASKLALTVLLVALGSALANPVESKAAERRDLSYRKGIVDSYLINKGNVDCAIYVVFRGYKKAKIVLFAKPGKFDRADIDANKVVFIILACGKNGELIRPNTGPGYLADSRMVAGKYPFANVVVKSPQGLRAETGVVYEQCDERGEGCREEARR